MQIHRQSIYYLVFSVALLAALGMVMLASTGAFALDARGNPAFFIKRQAVWLGVGVVVCAVAAMADYHFWKRTWWVWYGLAMVLLVLCFVPPIGQRINGSARWINLRVASFQPSELAKLAAIAALAWWFDKHERHAGRFARGFLIPLSLAGGLMVLIAPEVDMGSTALIGMASYVIMFVAGTKLRFLLPLVLVGVLGLGFAIAKMPERTGRFMAFLDPEAHPADAYQTQQGLIALGSGGEEGRGLGNGRQKMMFLPFAHTDFIFAPLGEELGLRCTLLVVFLYVVFIASGCVIALRAQDRFGMLFGIGFVVLIALQAAINIGVVTSLLPNKGMPLPFISYGGSNLVLCLLGVGVLISIYRSGSEEPALPKTTRLEARLEPQRRGPRRARR